MLELSIILGIWIILSVMAHNAAIDAQNVTVQFGTFAALHDVSVQIPSSKITGLIGPSGAGKTTLMRSIVGRQKLNGGHITVFGRAAGEAGLRSLVSYKTQEASAYYDLSVVQNLRYFATMMNMPRREAKAEVQQIVETLGLVKQSKQRVGTLSGGQKQRVSLAIALIGKPKLMVLDEPTVGLDPILRDELWELFRRLADEGTSLLISSHVMEEASRCDNLILIRNGQIVAYDTPDHIRQKTHSKTVEESFLKLAREEA